MRVALLKSLFYAHRDRLSESDMLLKFRVKILFILLVTVLVIEACKLLRVREYFRIYLF